MNENNKEMNLQALVNKLQTEGIEKADSAGKVIVRKAEEQAERICEKARAEAKEIIRKAQIEAEKFQKNALVSVELAGRDLILSLKNKIKELFDGAFKGEIAAAMDEKLLTELISKLVDNWANGLSVNVQVNDAEADILLKQVRATVNHRLKDSIVIRPNRNISNGFRISLKGKEVDYDFTDETIAEALKVNLNGKLAELITIK